MIEEGKPAPDFSLQDQHGKTWKLSELRGKHVVVYFYPKDDTPGCTVEACGFRDSHEALERAGTVVLGLSPDDIKSHKKFADKYQLPFTLLADEGHQIGEAFGAWGEKNNYGKKYMGILRSTFLVGPDGNVKKTWPKVSPKGHDAEVLAAILGEPAPAAATSAAPRKDPAAKKAPAAMKAPAAKSAARTTPAKKAAAAKSTAKKAAAAKSTAKKAPAKKAPAKKAPAKKAPAKKAPAKKAPAKKTAAKKTAAKKAARRARG